MRGAWIAGLFLLLAPCAGRAAEPERQVLPEGVTPARYDLHIVPDAQALTFKGEVMIEIVVDRPTASVTLNAQGLTFDHTALDQQAAEAVSLDAKLQRATIAFARPIAPGRHRLSIAYHGPITTGTIGFFAMDYDTPAGKQRTLATNFEPTSARMLLPCWDEPGKKAVFSVSVDAPADRIAVSNMPVATTAALGGGLQRVTFARTPKMSTYLLFLSVGDYERIHQAVDGVDVGVVYKRGDQAKAAYALGQATGLLHYYDDYFGVRFALPKLDLIAAPGQITGGSMENWGSIFYSQDELLFDPQTSTEDDRQLVFLVVAHEMSHQWFGDLVTMAWWDNLWLNEGFARWMQTHAADALHPQWRTGLQALAIFEGGKQADSRPSTHPVLQPIASAEQATQAFDEITYDKGAGVITMLEAYIGPDAFREGVRRYMKAHAYGNTVDADLWGLMQAAAGKPILKIEQDFTRQPGVPLIEVKPGAGASTLNVGRFYEEPDTAASSASGSWSIPLPIQAGDGPAQTVILDGRGAAASATPLVNAGATAFVRVRYAPAQVQALAGRMAALPAADQLNLLSDAWALGQSGYAPASNVMLLLRRLPATADPIVWRRAVRLLLDIDQDHAGSPQRPAFRRYALSLLQPVAARIGQSATPGEDAAAATLRGSLARALARFGDAASLALARDTYAKGTGGPAERRAALTVTAEAADPATFDALLAKARATADPLLRQQILEALAGAGDPGLTARMVEVALGPDAPAGSAPELLSIAADANPDAAWAALAPHLDDPKLPLDEAMKMMVIPGIAGQSALPQRAQDLSAYADRHLPADARQAVDSALAQIAHNAKVQAQVVPVIDAWIAQAGA